MIHEIITAMLKLFGREPADSQPVREAETMSLSRKQGKFVYMQAMLIMYAHSMGYYLTEGRGRVSEEANKADGGIDGSLHLLGLAKDFNLFDAKTGKFLKETSDHEVLGLYWEHLGGSWGGRFGDGNHYSLEHNGVR